MKKIDCFIPYAGKEQAEKTVQGLQITGLVGNIHLVTTDSTLEPLPGCELLVVDMPHSSATMKAIAQKANTEYTLLYTKETTLELGMFALERMMHIAEDSDAGMVYADHYQIAGGKQTNAPVIDYQFGSLRDDFNFGSVLLFNTSRLKEAAGRITSEYNFAGLYDLRLKLSQNADLVHINEYLYSEVENDTRKSGEKIFDYVDPKNRNRQIEMEEACTEHLKEIGGYLEPEFKQIEFSAGNFEYEASVIIPVRNRIRTIRDAIRSVLSQKTDFKFNLIIIDNHSTDGTTEAIDEFKNDERLIHIIPERNDLGIGGCWNMGVHHPKCGKFAIQLDSDDVYANENTLAIMVRAFYEQNCAMVVGTYMMTDFNMNMIAPGIIDHKEWTPHNGRHNALRINGLGAPRAFYTPVLREVKVPNTSYGEDYALGLNFSRRYQIGRVYEVVYLCRRWDDNSDASLDVVKMNGHNLYKDRIRTWELQARVAMNKKNLKYAMNQTIHNLLNEQLVSWETARNNYAALSGVQVKELNVNGILYKVQFNPARIVSSGAKVDAKSIKERKCFLCPANLPAEQKGIPFEGHYNILVNPFPIFPRHLTIPETAHVNQRISPRFGDMLDLAQQLTDYTIFYNGPKCGASAPDHAHFQAGNKGFMPIEQSWRELVAGKVADYGQATLWHLNDTPRTTLVIESADRKTAIKLFDIVYHSLDIQPGEDEPMMNVLGMYETGKWIVFIFPRAKHRPACYTAEGDANLLSSPASVDLGGVFITPVEKDFIKITAEDIAQILGEVCLSPTDFQKVRQRIKEQI